MQTDTVAWQQIWISGILVTLCSKLWS